MKKTILFGAGLLAFLAGAVVYAQNCTGTHTEYCNPYLGKDKVQKKTEEASFWTATTQSKSGSFVKGDTVDINIVVQKDQKYRVTVCSADEALQPDEGSKAGKIQYLIVEEKTTVAVVDKPYQETREKKDADGNLIYKDGDTAAGPVMETVTLYKKERIYTKKRHPLYDNAEDGNAQTYIFASDRTRKLTIRVITPAGEGKKRTKDKLGTDEVVCVGVLIEHAKGTVGINKAR